MSRILIIEDKQSLRTMLRRALEKAAYAIEEAPDGHSALEKLRRHSYDLVLTDLRLPDALGLEILRDIKNIDASIPVIFMTAYGSVETAVEAMKGGAYDFIQKPIDIDYLQILIARALERKQLLSENFLLKEEVAAKFGVPRIVGEHPCMVDVSQQAQQVAATNTTVLLLGESGTGKELFAKAIHNLSPRKEFPFVTVNCAAIPEMLLENELFGHEKGAYTGATERCMGKFELANRGTIFLDEVGELPLSVQSKILRVIEERKVDRIGGNVTIDVDVRIVAATNRDLKSAVEKKEFREDLFYRLSVFPITLPPIRERKSDIPFLVKYFLDVFATELNKKQVEVSAEALQLLTEYDWPGNVRELRNCIERAIIVCNDDVIKPEDLNINKRDKPSVLLDDSNLELRLSLEGTLNEITARAIERVEKVKIESILRELKGNKLRAAEKLDISYKTLLNKIKEYGIGDGQ